MSKSPCRSNLLLRYPETLSPTGASNTIDSGVTVKLSPESTSSQLCTLKVFVSNVHELNDELEELRLELDELRLELDELDDDDE
jgi:hypothetical protein